MSASIWKSNWPALDKEGWRKQIDEACHKILSNPVIEDYKFEIE